MGVIQKLPSDSMFLPQVNLFTAAFNTPTVGQYDWGVSANEAQEVAGIAPNFLYFMSILNFGASIDEAVFLENIDTIPRVQFLLKDSAKGLFGGGYPIANYLKNNELSAFFWTTQREDALTATFTGVLNQSAALAGVPSITAHVSVNMFQIVNKEFIQRFHGLTDTSEEEAGFLMLPPELERRI